MRRDVPDDSSDDSFSVVPATPDPVYEDLPTAPLRTTPAADVEQGYDQPTVLQPAQPAYVVAEPYVEPMPTMVAAPISPMPEPLYIAAPPERRWGVVAMAAMLALLVGGIIGLLLGRSTDGETSSVSGSQPIDSVAPDQAVVDQRVNDIFTLLVAQTQQPGGISTPTPYPALDQFLALTQGAGGSVDSTTASTTPATEAPAPTGDALDQLATLQQQNATLQQQLATAQAERDDLQAMIEGTGATTGELQQLADEQAKQITQLQNDLATAQADLDAATAKLAGLYLSQADNFVGADIAKVRSLAETNGWTLVEKQVDSTSAAPNTVTLQAPAAGANMVTGSVLYVEVARKAK